MFRSVSTVEGHGLKCCKSPERWANVSSWHSWWRCLKWIRSLVQGTGFRPLQMDLSPSLNLWTTRFHLIITGIILKSSHHLLFGLDYYQSESMHSPIHSYFNLFKTLDDRSDDNNNNRLYLCSKVIVTITDMVHLHNWRIVCQVQVLLYLI